MRIAYLSRFIIWLFFWGGLFFPSGIQAENPDSGEDAVKTAFLYNFAKFVDWPTESFKNESSPFVLGILGTDPFGSALNALQEKTVKGRHLVIRRLANLENIEECHMLFISSSEKSNLRSLLPILRNHNVLTTSDIDRFAKQGGMIGLIKIDGKIGFEVNIDTVQNSRLKFSSQLLKLAKIVRTGA